VLAGFPQELAAKVDALVSDRNEPPSSAT
jgi:hypothetical protein